MGRRLVTVALTALMIAPASALATLGPDAPASAESRYQIGRRLYREGQFAEAAAEFKAALALYPSAKLAYNQARSAERAGDLA
jgi:TolA-binding protein